MPLKTGKLLILQFHVFHRYRGFHLYWHDLERSLVALPPLPQFSLFLLEVLSQSSSSTCTKSLNSLRSSFT